VGDHPLGVAVVTTTNKIYAANLNSWTVTPIRGNDHEPLGDIYVGAQACKLVADHGDGRVYVTNHVESDNGAAAINSQTDQFLYYYTRLHATQGRYGIALDPDAEKLFIAARDGGLIAIQDAFYPDQEPQLFKLDPPRVPYVADFNPVTGHLFVTAADDNLVVVLDPYSIQWTKGRWVIIRGWPVFLLDKANAGWIAEIGVGLGAEEGIAVNPQTGYVYVSNAGSDTVSILRDSANPANIGWVKDLAVGETPQGVAVDTTRNLIYVGNAGSRTLTVINGATNTVVKTIPLE
jgi:YVTN family beta-propeller protein